MARAFQSFLYVQVHGLIRNCRITGIAGIAGIAAVQPSRTAGASVRKHLEFLSTAKEFSQKVLKCSGRALGGSRIEFLGQG